MRCWCGYLPGPRCGLFACGPADATAISKPRNLLPYLNPDRFLPRDAMLARYMPWPCVRVCLCLSVTSRCSTKTAKQRITQTKPHDSAGTIVFLTPKISAKFDPGHPLRGRQMQAGWVKIGDFRQIARDISKTVQDRRMFSIKVE